MSDGQVPELDSLNIGPYTTDNLTVKEVVETFLGNTTHHDDVQYGKVDNLQHEAGLLMLDIRKAKDKINWEPLLDAHQAIKWSADWYLSDEQASAKTKKQINQYLNIWDEKYN